jgi:D-xylonolactonase
MESSVTKAPNLERISSGHGLLEGPVWHPQLGLIVADAIVGGAWAYGDGREPVLAVAHRRGIGGMALHVNGGIVIGGRNIALKQLASEGDDETSVLLANDPARGVLGFNDLCTDAEGRIYVGSVAFIASDSAGREGQPPGRLHLIDLDGTSRVVAEDVLLSNGLGFSPDGQRLYHSDSLRNAVYVYEVKPDGDLGEKRLFAETGRGLPDGLAVDSGGTVWVALAEDSRVTGYSPEGREIASIGVPEPMVTSLCFGGPDLRDLYIVSGSEGLDTDRGGSIHRLRVDVPGLARPLARVKAA